MDDCILEMENITKEFPGVKALDNVSLRARSGTVHALMGENGAGKSTLMKCLFGMHHPDSGTITFKGRRVKFHSAKDALEAGISMIHQELSNVPKRTVAQNIWIGREPLLKKTIVPIIDDKKMVADTDSLLKGLGLDIDPSAPMGSLSIAEQQSCEIARAVSYGAQVVVMDEPTSSLSEREVEHLFKIIRDLRAKGVAIIYISHRMEEIFKVADEITVMRDGCKVGTYPAAEMDSDKLIKLMIGRVSSQRFPVVNAKSGDVALRVENFTSAASGSFKDISIELRRSEILGLGGLVGAQRTEFVESLFGLRPVASGKVFVNGKEVSIKSPHDAIKNGIGLITEDRRGSGLFPLLDIIDNTSIASLDKYKNKAGLLRHREIAAKAVEINKTLRTKTPTMQTQIQNLSGGNQQKVIVSRWLMTLPDILIMDEPTRGIDVGAKYEIYTIMAELARQGKSIIMVSSEMPELIGMSDRIAVLCAGRLTGTLLKSEATQESIMRLAAKFS